MARKMKKKKDKIKEKFTKREKQKMKHTFLNYESFLMRELQV